MKRLVYFVETISDAADSIPHRVAVNKFILEKQGSGGGVISASTTATAISPSSQILRITTIVFAKPDVLHR